MQVRNIANTKGVSKMKTEKIMKLISATGKLDAILYAADRVVEESDVNRSNTPENCRFLELFYMAVEQMAEVKGIVDSIRPEKEVG